MPDDTLQRVRAKLATVPADKQGVLLVALEWKYGVVPLTRWGVASRVGKHLELAADVETKFSKVTTAANVYGVFTW